MGSGSLHEVRRNMRVQDAPAAIRFERCLWGAGMRTNLNKIWAWAFVAAVATTGCSSTKPFAKSPPQMPPNAMGMNPTLNNNNNANAMAKNGWNQPPGKGANPLAIPTQNQGNAAPVIPANGMNANGVSANGLNTNGMNANAMNGNVMNPNQPPAMPGGMTTIPPSINNQPPVQPTNYQAPPQPVAPLNQSNASPYPGNVPTAGQRLPDSMTRNSMPIQAPMPEPVSTSNMLPQPVPPAMDVPAAAATLPSMSPMPRAAGMPAPQNLAPPAQLPPVSSLPPAPTPLPVRARPQE